MAIERRRVPSPVVQAQIHPGLLAFAVLLVLFVTGVVRGGERGVRVSPLGVAFSGGMFALLAILGAIPAWIEIGEARVERRWMGLRRRFDYARVRGVRVLRQEAKIVAKGEQPKLSLCVMLTLDDGRSEILWKGKEEDRAAMNALADAIRERRDAFVRGPSSSNAELVARRGRSISEWVGALKSIGAGANAGPRTPHVDTRELQRIVEDRGADDAARVAAAIAIRTRLPVEERKGLRVAADATDDDALARAIHEIADEGADDPRLEAILEEIAERPRKRA